MRKQSQLFKRIVRPYFLVITIILSISMVVVYSASVEKIENEAANTSRQLANKTAQQLDTYIEELDLLAEQVKHQSEITGVFYSLRNNVSEKNHFENDVLNSIELSSTLKGLLADRTVNYNICIYNEFHDFVSSQNFQINKTDFENKIASVNYDEELKQIRENGGYVVIPPQKNPWTDSSSEFITLKKELKNDYSNAVCGIIEVRVNAEYVIDNIGIHSGEGISIIVRDRSDGQIIYPYVHAEDNSSYITAPLAKTDWEVAVAINSPLTDVYSVQILVIFVLIYILLLCFSFFIAESIGRYVTRPISQLAKSVRKIDLFDDKLRHVEGETIDEIKELEDSFDKMLTRMNHSIQQERKAYSLALQAQMNPHFLYNMLSVMSSASNEAGCDNVSDMCVELSEMLRYVTAYQAVTVSLRDEIEHTKHYLSLMKSRYEDYFTYEIAIDDELMTMPVPKLFIQPLAENSFAHGFKQKEPPWHISIKMAGNIDAWTLVIKDNGTGIDEDKIKEIENKIEKAVAEMTLGEIGGLGIINTIARLKMTHNEKIRYRIYNDDGMVIKITSGK